jgi:hypothetical protein
VYLVLRQHADKQGGWHTESHDIRGIVRFAIEKAREAWRASGKPAP